VTDGVSDALGRYDDEPVVHEMHVGLCEGVVREGKRNYLYWQCYSCRDSSGHWFGSVEAALEGGRFDRGFNAHAAVVQKSIERRLERAGKRIVDAETSDAAPA
jgi:hypothetical protein